MILKKELTLENQFQQMLMIETKPINKIDYKHFHTITTRWRDNDVYGHINNVTYYSYFDTAVNHYLINKAGLDIHIAPIVGFVVNSQCNYLAPIAFPDTIEIGLRVNKIGNSSVTYSLAVFKKGETQASAYGSFVHVFVNRNEQRSVSIPEPIRKALEALLILENPKLV